MDHRVSATARGVISIMAQMESGSPPENPVVAVDIRWAWAQSVFASAALLMSWRWLAERVARGPNRPPLPFGVRRSLPREPEIYSPGWSRKTYSAAILPSLTMITSHPL